MCSRKYQISFEKVDFRSIIIASYIFALYLHYLHYICIKLQNNIVRQIYRNVLAIDRSAFDNFSVTCLSAGQIFSFLVSDQELLLLLSRLFYFFMNTILGSFLVFPRNFPLLLLNMRGRISEICHFLAVVDCRCFVYASFQSR